MGEVSTLIGHYFVGDGVCELDRIRITGFTLSLFDSID